MAEEEITAQVKAEIATAEVPEGELFSDKWDRLSQAIDAKAGKEVSAKPVASIAAEPDEPEDLVESDEEPEVEEEPEAEEPEAAEEQTEEQRLEALKAQAKELGLVVEDGKITTKDAVKFRNAKKQFAEQTRREREEIDRLKSEAQNEAAKIRQEASSMVDKAQRIVEAIEKGSFDDKAEALGYKNWEEMIDSSVAEQSDPHYKEMRELKKKLAAREEAEVKAKQEAEEKAAREKEETERRTQQEQLQERRNRERQWIGERSAQSQDAVVKQFADDPLFVGAVHNILLANMDPETGESVTIEQALDLPVPGGKRILRDVLKEMGGRFAKAFPDLWKPAEATDDEPELGKPKAPKSSALKNRRRRGGGGADEDTEKLSFRELKQRSDQRIHEALAKAATDDKRARVRY